MNLSLLSLVPGPFWGAVCLGVGMFWVGGYVWGYVKGEGQVCPGGVEPHPFPGYMGRGILRDTVDKWAVRRVPTRPGKPGKMRVHLENLEISWNFEKFNKYHGKMT